MPRCSFTQSLLDSIKPPAPGAGGKVRQVDYFDETAPRFGLRVSSNNVRTWFYFCRVNGTQRRFTIGRCAIGKSGVGLTLAQARVVANKYAVVIAEGRDPRAEAEAAQLDRVRAARQAKEDAVRYRFSSVVAEYIEKYAKGKNRSWKATERILNSYLVPEWGHRPIQAISRRDVTDRLEAIAKDHGRATAHLTLAAVRHMFRWMMRRDDKFTSPIVPGMGSGPPPPRERALADPEIKAIWELLGDDQFDSIVKLLFLTGQRRGEVTGMCWSEIDREAPGGPVWTIPAARYKTKVDQTVPLTADAMAVLAVQPRRLHCDLVFSTNGVTAFSGFSKKKAELDAASGIAAWSLHDIRRTVRTLMPRMGVSEETAERVIGHLRPTIVRTYDRYAYLREKRDALERLTVLIGQIEKNLFEPSAYSFRRN